MHQQRENFTQIIPIAVVRMRKIQISKSKKKEQQELQRKNHVELRLERWLLF